MGMLADFNKGMEEIFNSHINVNTKIDGRAAIGLYNNGREGRTSRLFAGPHDYNGYGYIERHYDLFKFYADDTDEVASYRFDLVERYRFDNDQANDVRTCVEWEINGERLHVWYECAGRDNKTREIYDGPFMDGAVELSISGLDTVPDDSRTVELKLQDMQHRLDQAKKKSHNLCMFLKKWKEHAREIAFLQKEVARLRSIEFSGRGTVEMHFGGIEVV
jgi:hypothetical protein